MLQSGLKLEVSGKTHQGKAKGKLELIAPPLEVTFRNKPELCQRAIGISIRKYFNQLMFANWED